MLFSDDRPTVDGDHDIDNFFCAAMGRIGGVRPELLFEFPDGCEKADIFVPDLNIVVEQKTLSKEFKDDKLSKRFNHLLRKWGVTLPNGAHLVNTNSFPEYQRNQLFDTAAAPLYRTLRKARSQIKRTIEICNLMNSQGLIFIVNNGNTFFSPQFVMNAFSRFARRNDRDRQIAGIFVTSWDIPLYSTWTPDCDGYFVFGHTGPATAEAGHVSREVRRAWDEEWSTRFGPVLSRHIEWSGGGSEILGDMRHRLYDRFHVTIPK